MPTPDWLGTAPLAALGPDIAINCYFHHHPEMVLGTWSRKDTLYGEGYSVSGNGDLALQLQAAICRLPETAHLAGFLSPGRQLRLRRLPPAEAHITEGVVCFLERGNRQGGGFWQAADSSLELQSQVAVAAHAVAFAVERVLARPGAKDHFGVMVEIAVDGDVRAKGGKRRCAQPVRVGMVGRLAGCPLAEENDVGDHGGALALEGIGWQPYRTEEVGPVGRYSRIRGILLVEGVSAM